MKYKITALAATCMVLFSSMAFANNHYGQNYDQMSQQGYHQHQQNTYHENRGQGHQAMYAQSEQAGTHSTSWWNSVCNFFGFHNGHGNMNGYSHNGYGHRGGGHM